MQKHCTLYKYCYKEIRIVYELSWAMTQPMFINKWTSSLTRHKSWHHLISEWVHPTTFGDSRRSCRHGNSSTRTQSKGQRSGEEWPHSNASCCTGGSCPRGRDLSQERITEGHPNKGGLIHFTVWLKKPLYYIQNVHWPGINWQVVGVIIVIPHRLFWTLKQAAYGICVSCAESNVI